MDGLDFTVGVGESHFGIDLARPLDALRQGNGELAGARLVEGDGLLVGDQLFAFAAAVDGEGAEAFLVEIDMETEGLIALELRPARPQGGGNLGFHALGGAAVEEGKPQGERHLLRRHLARRNALDAAGKHRQAEVRDAELAALLLAPAAAGEHDEVAPAFGGGGDLPGAGGAAAGVPAHRLAEFVAAAFVLDDQFGGQALAVRIGKAPAVALPGEVFHGDGFAGPE